MCIDCMVGVSGLREMETKVASTLANESFATNGFGLRLNRFYQQLR